MQYSLVTLDRPCFFDETGQVQCYRTDITNSKQTSEALLQNEARATALREAIPDLMFRMSRMAFLGLSGQ